MTAAPEPIRLLTFTTLYPNAASPMHGIFVENRLRHLVGTGRVVATVMAPIPWFPSRHACFGMWARAAAAPRRETRHGIGILHPRFVSIPRIGMSVAPALLTWAAARALRRLLAAGARFDAIDAHYFYPDGVAAIRLGQLFGLPVVITARGSDVTLLPDYALPRRMIRWAAREAAGIITVSAGLRDRLCALGVSGGKIAVLRNGVDLGLFRPLDRDGLRARLGLAGKTLISVGALIERKGHHRIIDAMAALPEWDLLIVGEGPALPALQARAQACGVASRVRFLGACPHEKLPELYGAADISVLASSREGWANVLLESMACGTPVVASDIPGNNEIVTTPDAGILMGENSPSGIAQAVQAAFATCSRSAALRHAEQFDWAETSAGQISVFRAAVAAYARP